MTWVDPSNLVLSVALMLPEAFMVAGEIEMTGVVVPVATLIGAMPVTVVTVPLPVPAPMVVLTAAASASCRMSKAKSVITLTVRFPALLLEGNELAGIERSVGAAAEPALFTLIEFAAIFAILALVTELAEMAAGKLPVPDPTTSPVRMMVWLPVLVPVMASNFVLSAALMLPAAVVVAGEIEMAGVVVPVATEIGDVPLTLVTVPLDGVDQLIPPLILVDKTCPLLPTELLMSPLELFKITP